MTATESIPRVAMTVSRVRWGSLRLSTSRAACLNISRMSMVCAMSELRSGQLAHQPARLVARAADERVRQVLRRQEPVAHRAGGAPALFSERAPQVHLARLAALQLARAGLG